MRLIVKLEQSVEDLKIQIEELKSKDQQPAKQVVAVKARLSKDVELRNGEKVIYDDVVTNQGNAYDRGTGIFTATVDGTYLFAVKTCSYTGYWDGLIIVHDGAEIGRALSGDSYYGDCGTEVSTTFMRARSKVWIQRDRGTTGGVQRSSHGCSFTAILVA